MSRFHWLYGGKKRGERRTGPTWVGRLGEAALYGGLFGLGVTSLTGILTWQMIAEEGSRIEVGRGFWALILVVVSFMIIGGAGLVNSLLTINASRERRSALAQHAADLDLLAEANPHRSGSPNVPYHPDMTNSPGVVLSYRLPPADTPAWKLMAGALLCVAWLAAAVSILVFAFKQIQSGQTGWLLLGFGAPFLAVGAWATQFFGRQLWALASFGPTSAELSHVPLYPGGDYEAAFSQAGALSFRSLELWLVCEEEATFSQGTDIRTETHTIYRQMLFRQRRVKIEPAQPFQQTCRLSIPEDAMHSFQSNHNAVNWKLVVRAEHASRPAVERSFPILVYPLPLHEEGLPATREEAAWTH